MTNKDLLEYWKSSEHRLKLAGTALAGLLANPAGLVELPDEALDDLLSNGGAEADATRPFGWDSVTGPLQ
jgi:mersacidin/lichenicidin family type 2 lantibiotic